MTSHDHRDDELTHLLRDAADSPPHDDVDWNALHARIQLRAGPLLRQPRTTWWLAVAGWSRHGIPLGAAAAAALVVALGSGIGRDVAPAAAPVATTTVAFRTIEETLADEAPLLVTDATSDELIEAMLLYEPEVW